MCMSYVHVPRIKGKSIFIDLSKMDSTATKMNDEKLLTNMIYKSDFSPPNLMDLSIPNGFLCSLIPESRSSWFFSYVA